MNSNFDINFQVLNAQNAQYFGVIVYDNVPAGMLIPMGSQSVEISDQIEIPSGEFLDFAHAFLFFSFWTFASWRQIVRMQLAFAIKALVALYDLDFPGPKMGQTKFYFTYTYSSI